MSYKLTKVNFVNKKQEHIASDFHARSFCCVGNDIYFLHENGIGLLSQGKIDLNFCESLAYVVDPEITNLSSIFYSELNDSLYVVSHGGSQVCKVGLQMLEFEYLISQDSAKRFQDKFLSTDKSQTYITHYNHQVVWSVRDCHRCFKMSGEKAIPLVGCGRSGFSLSNLKCTKICHPTGVAIMEKTICFADSGNKCLRGIKGDSTFNIIDNCKDIKDLFYSNKKLFFLSDNGVHMLSSEGDMAHLFEVYKVEHKIQSFCPTGKDCVYILEEDNASTSKKAKSGQSP